MKAGDILNRETLIEDITMLLEKWDEKSQFKLAGVGNLSLSDLDSLELYAREYNGYNLIEPRGDIAKILRAYNVMK